MVGFNPEPINGRELSASEYSEAGLLSGIATRAIIQPLDVLKIRFQLQEEPIRGKKSGKYKGVVQSVRVIIREEGSRAFWKGHVPAQGLSAVYGLVQFSSFEFLSRQLARPFPHPNHRFILPLPVEPFREVGDFACGMTAGCLAMTAAMPLDVIRTRLVAQGEPRIYSGTFHAIGKIWEHEGIPGYFRGWAPSLAQVAPYTGLQFALYNLFVEWWGGLLEHHEISGALVSCFLKHTMEQVCGASAGTVSKTVLYPLDMVRHRLQMKGFERGKHFGKTSSYDGMLRTFLRVVRVEGWMGLFKGLWPSQIKAAANSGFSFLFYEIFCDLLRKY